MNCPNCGLANPDNARFCANCGTQFGGAQQSPPLPQSQLSGAGPYRMEGEPTRGNSLAKNIGLGCLIAIVIFMLLGLSCTRACFGHRRTYYYHRY
jgi:uncharacterized membrane protein YvbJ